MSQAVELRNSIESMNKQFMTAFKQRDAAGMAELYTEDGQLLPPNGDFVTGRPGIESFWQGVMDMGIKEAEMEIVEVEEQGDAAIEVSTFKLLGEQGELLDEGKYIVIWKQEDGEWKLHRDIFNSSRPVA